MADIDAELRTIANDIYGKNVKKAIHDALDKINKDMATIDPSESGHMPIANPIIDVLYGTSVSVAGNPVGAFGWEFEQLDSDAAWQSAELTIFAKSPCILLACAMHRSDATVSGDGWTKVVESPGIDPTNRNQRITVWSKPVSYGYHTVSVTQTSANQMTMKLICLYNAASVSVSESCIINPLPYTPTAKIGKRRLYILSSAYAWDTYAVVISNEEGLDLQHAEETRFSVFYDYKPEGQGVPSFDYYTTPYYDNINLVVLDITEVE